MQPLALHGDCYVLRHISFPSIPWDNLSQCQNEVVQLLQKGERHQCSWAPWLEKRCLCQVSSLSVTVSLPVVTASGLTKHVFHLWEAHIFKCFKVWSQWTTLESQSFVLLVKLKVFWITQTWMKPEQVLYLTEVTAQPDFGYLDSYPRFLSVTIRLFVINGGLVFLYRVSKAKLTFCFLLRKENKCLKIDS